MKSFITCDVGLLGGLCWFSDGEMKIAEPMPVKDGAIDCCRLDYLISKYQWLDNEGSSHTGSDVIIEEIFAGGPMGKQSAIAFGKGYGRIEAIFTLAAYDIHYVHSRKWTSVMHQGLEKSLSSKEKSRLRMKLDYPAYKLLATPRSKKMHEGMMDAFLLGQYWLRVNS